MRDFIKPRAATLLVAMLPMLGFAQVPKVQTSAPAEKTTVKVSGADSRSSKAPSAPKAAANTLKAKAAKTTAKEPKTVAVATTDAKRYMAVKTNAAYDALALLNLAFEMQVAPRFTAELPVVWSFWDWETDKGVRTLTLQPGIKYHFSDIATGHAVGADIIAGWFNVRYDDKRYQDYGRPMLGASINYSYTLSLARNLSVEFALGVGYVNMSYNTYYNVQNGAWISREQRNYFGPTRVGISIAYTL